MCCPKQDDDDRVAVARICQLLASRDSENISEGISLVHRRYGHAMADWIRARFRMLRPDDIEDIWNSALFQLARLAREGRFKEKGSLHGLIRKIVLCRAMDLRRRLGSTVSCQPLLAGVIHDAYLFCVDDSVSLDELLEAVREAIGKLSGRQRAVLEAFANVGFDRKDEDFVAEASRRAGEPLTKSQIREALSKGLEKVAEYLRRRGYK